MPTDSRLVYSTDGATHCPRCNKALRKCRCDHTSPPTVTTGPLRITKSTKGRNGKVATVVANIGLADNELKTLLKALKKHCGVGGAIKNGTLELQGDQQEKIKPFLTQYLAKPR